MINFNRLSNTFSFLFRKFGEMVKFGEQNLRNAAITQI